MTYATHDVFGIKPAVTEHSYVDRRSLDNEFRKLIERKQTHIAIRGASKAGKSWLRQRVLTNPIIVQCRLSYTTADIYRDALAKLDINLEVQSSQANALKGKVSGSGEVGFKLIAKLSGAGEVASEATNTITQKAVGKDIDDLDFVAALIRESGRTLVIEDFHYLPMSEQKKFSFDLKTLWDYNTFVVVIGVWTSENMLMTLNSDLRDRIEELSVTWTEAELKQVLKKGCENLNLRMTDELTTELAKISYESVGLLQKLALRTLDESKVEHAAPDGQELIIDKLDAVHDAAMHIAEQQNALYQAFAKRVCDGIRSRKNATAIYAHAMAAIMGASDADLEKGLSATAIYSVAHARQPRIQSGNLKLILPRFAELQVDEEGRGLIIVYDPQNELVNVVDRQLLLYRRFVTVKWPWEELIQEMEKDAPAASFE